MTRPLPPPFTAADVERAHDAWGCNCGPTAIAAMLHLPLDTVRAQLGDFERKGYTNPTLMIETLRRLGVLWKPRADLMWPAWGLVRIQWHGPWMADGVPKQARYRHTHWVGSCRAGEAIGVFDVNCMAQKGWVSLADWSGTLVPWLLEECEPKANGLWSITHAFEVPRPAATLRQTSGQAMRETA